ncbi:hypothetical protein Bca4012_098489 [Brassica carinata]|uniref:Uncharacterized protein n=1 Tax=Brassica carinata TaxID=52824 RepID=A0A8X7PGW6_BRACI|nr:hypothetical protein Bca52824_081171 [Brassica carinata]
MILETAAFAGQLRIIHSEPDGIFSPGILFQLGYTLYPIDTKFSTWAANEGLRFYEAWPGLASPWASTVLLNLFIPDVWLSP